MTAYYQKMFIRDTQDNLTQLNPLLSRLESRNAGVDDIDKAFRIMHSIKSEAAHLNKKSIADLAHVAESVLQELKGDPQDEGHLSRLFDAVSRIEEEFSPEQLSSPEISSSEEDAAISDIKNAESHEVRFEGMNDFELVLLKEARDRGETFYRMICEFENHTEMLYPKAVLILNNLEQIVNVIRCKPDLSRSFEGTEAAPEYYFTTNRPETDLFNAVKVDQVQRVFLARLSWDQYLHEAPVHRKRGKESRRESQLIINRKDLVCLWFHFLKGRIQTHLIDASSRKGIPVTMDAQNGMSEALQATRFVLFEAGFQDLPEIVQRSAAEQAKEARCSIQGGEQTIERWFIYSLRNSLVQLLRNAVSHGIEEPSVRLKAGKSPRGEVSLRYERDEEAVNIFIQDDGKGIDEEIIRAKAMELGQDASGPLLSIITSPGFSTSDIISLEAGRGIGLDIVAADIARIPGAGISLESRENQGARFCISIPVKAASRTIIFTHYKQNTLAVDSAIYLGQENPLQTEFRHDDKGRVRYRDCPVYTSEGYLFWSDNFISDDILIKIRNGTEKFYLLVEKILFSEIFPEDLVSVSETEGGVPFPQLCIGEHKTGIGFLHGNRLFEPGSLGRQRT